MTTLLDVLLSHWVLAIKVFPPEFGMLLQNQKICEASFSKYCENYRETWHLCLLTDHTFAPFHLYCKPRSDQYSYKLYQDEQFYVSDKISDQACHLPINPRRTMYTSGQDGLGKLVVDISTGVHSSWLTGTNIHIISTMGRGIDIIILATFPLSE